MFLNNEKIDENFIPIELNPFQLFVIIKILRVQNWQIYCKYFIEKTIGNEFN